MNSWILGGKIGDNTCPTPSNHLLCENVNALNRAVSILTAVVIVSLLAFPATTAIMSDTVLETVELASGVVKEITLRGEGPLPAAGDEVVAHYTGRLLDGKVFDSSVTRGKPFKVGSASCHTFGFRLLNNRHGCARWLASRNL